MKRILYVLALLILTNGIWAQKTIIEEISKDKNISGGGYYAYPYPEHPLPSLTSAPKGYKPFYISHYARHGSRYYWNAFLYQELDSLLSKAHNMHVLTPEGEGF
ncbi:MAG: histidine-type phosphatase, partial [Bacteroidaceae bacterium]|nr:histidine-type phosphatase [Bacteroidaceae bacterium]